MGAVLAVLPALLLALPNLIKGVEALFNHKPKSGAQKLALVTSLVQNAAPIAEVADPKNAQAVADLTTTVTAALVTFYNVIGEFQHSS